MPAISLPYADDPLPLLQALRPLGHAVLLHSSDRHHPEGRFDILAAGPRRRLLQDHGRVYIEHPDGQRLACEEAPLTIIARWSAAYRDTPTDVDHLPFTGGVIGLAGYDFGRSLETLPPRRSMASPYPELIAGDYAWAVITDHRRRQSCLLATGELPAGLERRVREAITSAPPIGAAALPRLTPDVSATAYACAFRRVAAYIQAGDCYQVNLAIRFSAPFDGDPLALYAALSRRQPAPFAGFLDAPEGSLLSFSPERFLTIAGDRIHTCPIKGTRPRDPDPQRDRALAEELRGSSKDQAENLMIVDLLRNDLGRSCIPGSITVPSLFALESFSAVHHLVSRIEGRLAPDVSPLQAFGRAFPGGSITGAPKIRAMAIIDELETHGRGPYCGSLFLLDGRGRFDSSITIRTLLAREGQLHCWGGGGLVADSEVDQEWAEIHHKVGSLIGSSAQPV